MIFAYGSCLNYIMKFYNICLREKHKSMFDKLVLLGGVYVV